MKIMILGIDGYIGWPLALHLRERGHEVIGLDNLIRRYRVEHEGSDSLLPIDGIYKKQQQFQIDTRPLRMLDRLDSDLDAIVHLAEQPSAAWSMKNADTAFKTQRDNVLGTLNLLWLMRECCPKAHLLKLGSMGEFGTPDCVIPEGTIPRKCLDEKIHRIIDDDLIERPYRMDITGNYSCPMSGLPFPRSPGSFYHLSKVHDTHNIIFACKTWGLRSTDIMQGVVFGHLPGTRFDYDECFGTVLNRFCVQAVAGMPVTVYGKGGQTRGYLPLKDSIECLTLSLENPPKHGEYRVFNQFAETYSVNALATTVKNVGRIYDIDVKISHITNPRKEMEEHFYQPIHEGLAALGYKPSWDIGEEIQRLIEIIIPYKNQIRPEVLLPKIQWAKEEQHDFCI